MVFFLNNGMADTNVAKFARSGTTAAHYTFTLNQKLCVSLDNVEIQSDIAIGNVAYNVKNMCVFFGAIKIENWIFTVEKMVFLDTYYVGAFFGPTSRGVTTRKQDLTDNFGSKGKFNHHYTFFPINMSEKKDDQELLDFLKETLIKFVCLKLVPLFYPQSFVVDETDAKISWKIV